MTFLDLKVEVHVYFNQKRQKVNKLARIAIESIYRQITHKYKQSQTKRQTKSCIQPCLHNACIQKRFIWFKQRYLDSIIFVLVWSLYNTWWNRFGQKMKNLLGLSKLANPKNNCLIPTINALKGLNRWWFN